MSKYIDADKLWNRLISVSENDWVGYDTIDEVLSGIPAADVQEVRHGKWEPYLKEGLIVKCSVCGSRYIEPWNYCPNCGSRMDLEGDIE